MILEGVVSAGSVWHDSQSSWLSLRRKDLVLVVQSAALPSRFPFDPFGRWLRIWLSTDRLCWRQPLASAVASSLQSVAPIIVAHLDAKPVSGVLMPVIRLVGSFHDIRSKSILLLRLVNKVLVRPHES